MDPDVLEAYRPRLIVWELASPNAVTRHDQAPFSTHECLLTIDSIARTSKPIIVLTGQSVLQRADLFSIVEYGIALGLKVIIEVRPQDLSEGILRQYSVFGSRIFRVLVDDCIVEDADTRYRKSPQFVELEKTLERLRDCGFDIHLGVAITSPNVRGLAFHHDYAVKRVAAGLYCHLCFEDGKKDVPTDSENESIDRLVRAIAQMKTFSPKDMYFSPQCIKYVHHQAEIPEEGGAHNAVTSDAAEEWDHYCLGGKTFAYINSAGVVQLCAGLPLPCGELRRENYEFKRIWESAETFQQVRHGEWSCTETRCHLLNSKGRHLEGSQHEKEEE